MHLVRSTLSILLVGLLPGLAPAAALAGSEPGANQELAQSPVDPVVVPEGSAVATGGEPGEAAAHQESAALEQLNRKFATRIEPLEKLARTVKGQELADLQRRIEQLKAEYEREALGLRIDAARDAGNGPRVRQLEQVGVEREAAPATPAEKEPRPDRSQVERDGAR